MRTKIILLISCCISFFTFAQTPIAIQSFENSGDTWVPLTFSTPPCNSNNDVWDYVTSLPGINPSDGVQFWGIQDLDGSCGGTGFETIAFPDVNISTYNNVIFTFDYYAIRLDNGEDLKYQLFYDGIGQGEVIVVDGNNSSSDNTNGWKTETVEIPNTVSNISLILYARCNAGNERAGFDNVRLQEASNNVCEGAEDLVVYDYGASAGHEVTGDTSNTTPSDMSLTTCDRWAENYDLFYRFTMPVGESAINVLTYGPNGNTINLAVWDGCNGNSVFCSNEKSSLHEVTGLTPGNTYILQVWHDVIGGTNDTGPFTIALEKLPPPPANDDCPTATRLTVGYSSSENVLTGTNVNATNSGISSPSCASYKGRDVWYTATVPASGILTVETQNAGDTMDTGLAIYTGTCGNLRQIACNDDISGNNLYSRISLNGYANSTIYIRVWTYRNQTSGNFNIVAYTDLCPYTTRWNGSRWNNGTPNSYTSAVISGNYDTATNGSFESCNCTINSNRTVNIRANDHLTVQNDLIVDGTLEVRHEGSLVMKNDDGRITANGTINVYKTSAPFNQYDYMYWSSPMENQSIGAALNTSVADRIYRFNTAAYDETVYYNSGWEAVSGSNVMTPGMGYIAMGPITGSFPQTQDILFNGIPNTGIIETPIDLSADNSNDYDDWNLIGNPYPSAISADSLLNHPLNQQVVGGSIYLWTHNTERNTNPGEFDYTSDDYAVYTYGIGGITAVSGGEKPTGIIASGQGFFIDGISNGVITFNNSMRVATGNDQFYRGVPNKAMAAKDSGVNSRIWLNLSSDNGAYNQVLIGFSDGATVGMDRDYDGYKFGGGWVSFYTIVDGNDLAVQGEPPLTDEIKTIQLGYDSFIDNSTTLKIGIDQFEGDLNNYDILLKDKKLNLIHDLKMEDYNFVQNDMGIFNDRFELILKNSNSTLSVQENSLKNEILVIQNNDQIIVKTADGALIRSINIYSILGKQIASYSPESNEFNVNASGFKSGEILLLNISTETNLTKNKKIIIR